MAVVNPSRRTRREEAHRPPVVHARGLTPDEASSADVGPADPLKVALELDLGAETIGGRFEGPDGPLEFSGWLGLASALEQLIGPAPQANTSGLEEARHQQGGSK